MRVTNVHERRLPASAERVGALIDSLASREDRLWPRDRWPALLFDRPLSEGADGGHGPVRYHVEAYEPGESVRFRFTSPRGFDGTHGFSLERAPGEPTVLRHSIDMRVRGGALMSWLLVFRPLHDALLEDALDQAERSLGATRGPRGWSPWVRVLRRALRRPAAR